MPCNKAIKSNSEKIIVSRLGTLHTRRDDRILTTRSKIDTASCQKILIESRAQYFTVTYRSLFFHYITDTTISYHTVFVYLYYRHAIFLLRSVRFFIPPPILCLSEENKTFFRTTRL